MFLQADNIAASEQVFNHFERKVFFEKWYGGGGITGVKKISFLNNIDNQVTALYHIIWYNKTIAIISLKLVLY